MFSDSDIEQIKSHGLSAEIVKNQIERFISGFPYLEIKSSAVEGGGIFKPDDQTVKKLIDFYNESMEDFDIIKFVPASGAATRMFKHLYEFIHGNKLSQPVLDFIANIQKFAFYEDLKNAMQKQGIDLDKALENKDYLSVIRTVLEENGLNYGFLPKGLIKFHSYNGEGRTPFEEHLVEAANYASTDGKAKLHFTVSPEHRAAFSEKFTSVRESFEKRFGIKYEISYSVQEPSTDTIAVNPDNTPFRNPDESLLFRPGGHGALLENLNKLDADLIFIKNIDNVVPERLLKVTTDYKKLLAGKLLEIKDEIFRYQEICDSGKIMDYIPEIEEFYINVLYFEFPESYRSKNLDQRAEYLQKIIFRPIRVCGMVRNDGDTGGGPFIAKNPDGSYSLQIVESAQFNPDDEEQMERIKKATHFNPNDIACTIRNYKGEKYVLEEYRDVDTGFISKKSKDGKDLKALEHPGLWNGGMSNWNTLFVDVPLATFNPVKSVNDLLLDSHQQ